MIQTFAELIFNVALITVAVIVCSGGDPLKEPYKLDMCVVRQDGSTVKMEVWSDFVERYQTYYQGSTCGPCGKPRECPK